MHRAALAAAAIVGGVMVAMIVEIVLARRGILLVSIWQGVHRGGSPLRAALAWWAIAGGAFPAGFVLAFVLARVSWLYFRTLRFLAAAALTLVLSWIGGLLPPAAAGTAGHQALASLAALAAAMLMAGFGAFFAVRR